MSEIVAKRAARGSNSRIEKLELPVLARDFLATGL